LTEQVKHVGLVAGLFFTVVSIVVWILVAPYAMNFMGWSTDSVTTSYYLASLGAAVSCLMGRSRGRLRKILYDSAFSGYIDLILIAVPIAVVYILIIQSLSFNFPFMEKIAITAVSSPFTLVTAWIFSFSVYRVLEKLYSRVAFRSSYKTSFRGSGIDDIASSVKIKRKIEETISRLEKQRMNLSKTLSKMENRNKELFEKADAAQAAGNGYASYFANAYAETRKNAQFLLGAELAIEKVVTCLRTVNELRYMASAIIPTLEVISTLKRDLYKSFPDVSRELGKIVEDINEIRIQTRIPPTLGANNYLRDEAQKILLEADAVAREKMKTQTARQPI